MIEVNFVSKLQVERKKSFQIFCERKKISIEIWQHRLLMPDVQLGKGDLRLTSLTDKCEFTTLVDVKIGRKVLAQVEIGVRIRQPLLSKHIVKFVDKTLVIDEHFTNVPSVESTTSKKEEIKEEKPQKVETKTSKASTEASEDDPNR